MTGYQDSKAVVRSLYEALGNANLDSVDEVLKAHTGTDYSWKGVHPFNELNSIDKVAEKFWRPLMQSFTSLQRRQDVFFAGKDRGRNGDRNCVVSLGKFLGLFDHAWLGIPATGRIVFIPYVDFHTLVDGRISDSCCFVDIFSVMQQAGLKMLPTQTGAEIVFPGPKTHDGLLFDTQDVKEGELTCKLIDRMIDDLLGENMHAAESQLESTWHNDMCWFGPAGIGATMSIERYELQHQGPFASGLDNIQYAGHDCLVTEGHYGALNSWTGFTMRSTGGFMGLPASSSENTMRVVDVYRREGDKLAENWVLIDILHFLHQQGLDILERLESLNNSMDAMP